MIGGKDTPDVQTPVCLLTICSATSGAAATSAPRASPTNNPLYTPSSATGVDTPPHPRSSHQIWAIFAPTLFAETDATAAELQRSSTDCKSGMKRVSI